MSTQKFESPDNHSADKALSSDRIDSQHILAGIWDATRGDATSRSQAVKPAGTQPNDGLKSTTDKDLPSLELHPFDQPGTEKNGESKNVWDRMKGLFSHKDTLGDQVHDKVVKDLKPKEKNAFDEEEKKIQEHAEALKKWFTSTTVPPPPCPEAPVTPMHREVKKRTEDAERKIASDVRASMSPEEQKRLDEQTDTYERAMKKATEIKNPMGTGEGRGPKPEPGNAIKDYLDRIRESTDAYTR